MKYGVIDIGSNSVRLMLSDGDKTLYKKVKTTRLAEGMGKELTLKIQAIERTAHAVSFFKKQAEDDGADIVYAFATASVRQAVNRQEFIDIVKDLCGLNIEVVSGQNEALLGATGALCGRDGAIIDIGGASTEITVIRAQKPVYCKSIDTGVVKIKDAVGQDAKSVKEFVEQKIEEFGDVPKGNFYGIGGTATSLASIMLQLEPYDPSVVNSFVINLNELEILTEMLFLMTEEQKRGLKGLQPERAPVIAGGAQMMLSIMKKFGLQQISVSEQDNLEGYLIQKLENK